MKEKKGRKANAEVVWFQLRKAYKRRNFRQIKEKREGKEGKYKDGCILGDVRGKGHLGDEGKERSILRQKGLSGDEGYEREQG